MSKNEGLRIQESRSESSSVRDEEAEVSSMITPNGDVEIGEKKRPSPPQDRHPENGAGMRNKPPFIQRETAKGKTAGHRRTASVPVSLPRPFAIHGRAASTGDQSLLSALSDTLEYNNSKYESPSKASNTMNVNRLDQTSFSPKSVSSASSKWKITLSDLKATDPLETEAEAAILRAIEQKQAENETAVFLPNLSDEAVDMFHSARTSPRSSPKMTSPTSGSSQSTNTTARRRWFTASEQIRAQRIVNTSETLELANAMSTSVSSDNVQEKLVVLTEQIHDFQEEEDGSFQKETHHSPSLGGMDEPITQTDNLVRNANVLFRRSTANVLEPIREQDTDVEAQESNQNDKAGFFPFLRKHPKKSDQSSTNDLEIHTGEEEEVSTTDANRASEMRKKATSPVATTGKKAARKAQKAKNLIVGDFFYFVDFLRPRRDSIFRYCRNVLQWMFLPTLIVSFALYYAGNPTTCSDGCASFSWLFIFLFIRQTITFTLAKVLELLIIDFLSLRNRFTVKIIGPTLTLLVVQSKGWPFTLLMWAVLDFVMLYGKGEFANHWLYYQNVIPVFNAANTSGNALTDKWYFSALIAAVIVSCAYAVKRLWMGVYLGKRTYRQYGHQLASVMNDMLLVSLLAGLGHDDTEEGGPKSAKSRPDAMFKWDEIVSPSAEEEDEGSFSNKPEGDSSRRMSLNGSPGSKAPGSPISKSDLGSPTDVESGGAPNIPQPVLESSLKRKAKVQVIQLLGAWDEPHREDLDSLTDTSLVAMLQFRQALSYIDNDEPFSTLFGPARTRELCVASSQQLYERLLRKTPGEIDLPFETIAQVATGKKGVVNQARLKRLYRTFHPDSDGRLSLIDFVRSIDNVYKSLRLLRASIANSSQIDQNFERIFNVFFFIVLAFIVLPIIGLDPLALILSLSGLIVGFAFAIGPASSKFFEGILLILVRRPYDIGDRIHISSPRNDTGSDGSPAWFVEKVDLYSTTVRFAATNEVATYSNSSLAAERIINGARSPKAIVYVNLKFGVNVEYAKIEVFRTTVEAFVKSRTQEWLALIAFRATRVEADLGFVEYKLVLQHVSAWQDVGEILKSKAELSSYCLEVSKQLDMHYQAPPLPVKLDLSHAASATEQEILAGDGIETDHVAD